MKEGNGGVQEENREAQEPFRSEQKAQKEEAFLPVIGVTGGIGSGKSAVLRCLKECFGAYVLQTDDIAKELMQPGTACFEALRKAFGDRILSPSGDIDPQKYGALIYRDERLLALSDSLVHPAVWSEVRRRIEAYQEGMFCVKTGFAPKPVEGEGTGRPPASLGGSGRPAPAVVETALPGTELSRICTSVWYVHVPENLRTKRLMESRSMSEEAIRRILKRQPREADYRALSDAVIENGGSPSELEIRVKELMEGLFKGTSFS